MAGEGPGVLTVVPGSPVAYAEVPQREHVVYRGEKLYVATSHSTRQPLPTLGDAARLLAVLDALLDLGHGEVCIFEHLMPCASSVAVTWAELHGLQHRISDENVLRVTKGNVTVVAVHR